VGGENQERRVGQPIRCPAGEGRVFRPHDFIVQMHVGNNCVRRRGIGGGQIVLDAGVGLEFVLQIGNAILREFGAGKRAAQSEQVRDAQALGVGRVGRRRGREARRQAAHGNSYHVHFRRPIRVVVAALLVHHRQNVRPARSQIFVPEQRDRNDFGPRHAFFETPIQRGIGQKRIHITTDNDQRARQRTRVLGHFLNRGVRLRASHRKRRILRRGRTTREADEEGQTQS